eukprot:12204282-Alexandrium_andersonii.AAC.1
MAPVAEHAGAEERHALVVDGSEDLVGQQHGLLGHLCPQLAIGAPDRDVDVVVILSLIHISEPTRLALI